MDDDDATMDLPALLRSTVSSMNALHRFSADRTYFDDSSSSSNASRVERKKRGSVLLDTLSNHFITMVSVATLMLDRDAQLQVLLHPTDCDSMVQQMVVMASHSNSSDYSPLAAEMSDWFVRAIVSFIHWWSSSSHEEHLPPPLLLSDSSSVSRDGVAVDREGKYAVNRGIDRFNDQLLQTALRYRPDCSAAASHDMTRQASESSSSSSSSVRRRKYKALFHLLEALLSGPSSQHLSVSDEVRAVESSAVIRELRAVRAMHRQTAADFLELPNHSLESGGLIADPSSSSSPSSLVEGSLMVVTGLVSGRDEVVASLLRSDPSIVDFLLLDCLGLRRIPDCLADHLCKDQVTRYLHRHLE